MLLRERVSVTEDLDCTPRAVRRFKVAGYIGLRDDAATVRLLHREVLLWRAEIPELPTVRLKLAARPTREEPAQLQFKLSTPYAGAFLQVVYQWGERQHQVLRYVDPTEQLAVDRADLPGGQACRLVVRYSNGLRSAGVASAPFPLPLLGPQVSIVTPKRGAVYLPGQPLDLLGQVLDPERPRGPRPEESLTWLFDDQEVGRGPIAGLVAPPPGGIGLRCDITGPRT